MKIHHNPSHWALVALVLLALLLTLSEAHGQSGAATAFAGRPVMGGANGGQGAMAGLPQGGIGVQGTEAAERSLRLSKPSQLDDMRAAKREGTDMVEAGDANHQAQLEIRKDVGKDLGKDMAAPRDISIAKDVLSHFWSRMRQAAIPDAKERPEDMLARVAAIGAGEYE